MCIHCKERCFLLSDIILINSNPNNKHLQNRNNVYINEREVLQNVKITRATSDINHICIWSFGALKHLLVNLHMKDNSLNKLLRACNKAQSDSRAEDFGEWIESDDATLRVKRKQTRWSQMLLFKLEIKVGIILQKNEVVVATQLENLLAPVKG